jgi:hypothetical protein
LAQLFVIYFLVGGKCGGKNQRDFEPEALIYLRGNGGVKLLGFQRSLNGGIGICLKVPSVQKADPELEGLK